MSEHGGSTDSRHSPNELSKTMANFVAAVILAFIQILRSILQLTFQILSSLA